MCPGIWFCFFTTCSIKHFGKMIRAFSKGGKKTISQSRKGWAGGAVLGMNSSVQMSCPEPGVCDLATRDDHLERFLNSSGGQVSSFPSYTQSSGWEAGFRSLSNSLGVCSVRLSGWPCPGVQFLQVHTGVPLDLGASPRLGCASPRAMTPGLASRRS